MAGGSTSSNEKRLLLAVKNNRVLVVRGNVGSGLLMGLPHLLHQAGYTELGKIGSAQPWDVSARWKALSLSKRMNLQLGAEIGFITAWDSLVSAGSVKTVIEFLTHEVFVKGLRSDGHDVKAYSVIIVDEAQERLIYSDVLLGYLKAVNVSGQLGETKVIICTNTSSTADTFSQFFRGARILKIHARIHDDVGAAGHEVSISYEAANYMAVVVEQILHSHMEAHMELAFKKIIQIHLTEAPGNILVFCTRQQETENLKRAVFLWAASNHVDMDKLLLTCLYDMSLSLLEESEVFSDTPVGTRKITFATAIAESCICVPHIRYVVDTGFAKSEWVSPTATAEWTSAAPISKRTAQERASRVNSPQGGKCFRLWEKSDFETMRDDVVPEIMRSNLRGMFLTLLNLGMPLEAILDFEHIDDPPFETYGLALDQLYRIGAILPTGDLTRIGRKMAAFPVDPMLGKMLAISEQYRCSKEILTVASLLLVDDIFTQPLNAEMRAHVGLAFYRQEDPSDHLALLRIFTVWNDSNCSDQWCHDNYIHPYAMKKAMSIRTQLESVAASVEIEQLSNPRNYVAIKKCILSGYLPYAAQWNHSDGFYRPIFEDGTPKRPARLFMHQDSTWQQSNRLPFAVIFHQLYLLDEGQIVMPHVLQVEAQWIRDLVSRREELPEDEPVSMNLGNKRFRLTPS